MIGNSAGLSMLGGVDDKTLKEYPLFERLVPIIRQYEELRHQNYFNDSVRALLRQPGKEFKLFQHENGKRNFRPTAFQKHKVEGNDYPTAQWIVNNEFASQPVKLRIEPLMSVEPFDHENNVLLADFSSCDEFSLEGNAQGVTGGIGKSDEKITEGTGTGFAFHARANGESPREGSWIKMEKKFDPWLNLEKNQALGVWIKGDGNGELLNLRIESPEHVSMGARGDHFIPIDFTGWRYFELVEVESTRFNDYIWPDEYFNVYNSYFYTVHFDKVDKLQLWYNNLPANKEVKCIIGPVKALPMISNTIKNPAITIGDQTIVFPVEMKSGMFLEFTSADDCVLYGSKGEFIQGVDVKDQVPILREGDNTVSFTCESDNKQVNPRVQVTVIGEGAPL